MVTAYHHRQASRTSARRDIEATTDTRIPVEDLRPDH